MPPPFRTIGEGIAAGNGFWESLTNAGQINNDRALIIADFGLGSDSPIILYFGEALEPSVMYLQWCQDDEGTITHRWIETHSTFSAFALHVGLIAPQPSGGAAAEQVAGRATAKKLL